MRYHYYVMCDYICCFQLQIWKFYRYVVIIPSFTLLYVFSGEAGDQLIDWPNRHGQWHIEMPYFWAPIRWRVNSQEEPPAEGMPQLVLKEEVLAESCPPPVLFLRHIHAVEY